MFTELKGRYYQQVQSLRDLTRDNFPNGQIRFHWSIPANKSWNPALSFYVIRHELIKPTIGYQDRDGAARTKKLAYNIGLVTDGIAPTMFFNDSLWQQIEMRINGVKINKQDNYCHQIAALKHRMCPEPKNKTLNKFNFHDIDIFERAKKISIDGEYKNLLIDVFTLATGVPTIQLSRPAAAVGSTTTITLTNIGIDPNFIKPGGFLLYKKGDQAVRGRITATTATTIVVLADQTTLSVANIAVAAAPLLANELLVTTTPQTLNDNNSTNNKQIFETIWKPKLGFFGIDDWLPGGEYELILTPFPTGQLEINALEIQGPLQNANLTNTGDVPTSYNILNMYMNLCMCDASSKVKTLKFYETRCQAKTINVSSLSQKQLVVNKKTTALTLAYQDNRVNNSNLILSSLFKFGDEVGLYDNSELNLTRFYIHYDGKTLPNPIPDLRYTSEKYYEFNSTPNSDLFTQRYWESQFNKIAVFDDIETYDEWIQRGPYYHFQWPRTNAGATEVQIAQEFSSFNPNLKPQLLLFEHYPCSYSFDMHMGYITNVKQNN